MKYSPPIRGSSTYRSGMYLFVFGTRASFLCVLLLLLSILLQPIESVFAESEIIPSEIEVVTVADSPQNEEGGEEVVAEEIVQEVLDADGDNSEPQEEEDSNVIEEESPAGETIEYSNDSVLASSTPSLETDSEAETPDDNTENISSDESLTEFLEEPEESDTVATTTEEIATTSPAGGQIINAEVSSDSMVQFDKEACVLVSDGSFYCQRDTNDGTERPDGVYSFPDKDGDLEIYVQHDGTLSQVTSNLEDDSSPYFDNESNTMVWHRLIDDRYQIISYDVDSGEETQLTSGDVNSMEPTRFGDITVWQHWDSNWEIVLYDGDSKRQLTNSVEHDISPSIRNGLVVWHRLMEGSQKSIQLYNIATGEFTSIEDTDGGTISNPRMVVVYESTYENGDVVTKGYDLITGEIISLDATPVELPESIPNPESTGETRALIQGKVAAKEDGESEQTTPTVEPPPVPELGEFDLVIGSSTATSSTELPVVTSPEVSASSTESIADLTLDLRPETSTSSDIQFEIEDVIVPPFSEVVTSGGDEIETATTTP